MPPIKGNSIRNLFITLASIIVNDDRASVVKTGESDFTITPVMGFAAGHSRCRVDKR